jgi:hypothetical protein
MTLSIIVALIVVLYIFPVVLALAAAVLALFFTTDAWKYSLMLALLLLLLSGLWEIALVITVLVYLGYEYYEKA